MDSKDLEILRSVLALLQKEHQLLGDVLPIVNEIVKVLGAGQKPTDEQLRTWQERYDEMDRRLHELTGAFQGLVQATDPLFDYDA
jgi:hypothetical protein